MMALPFDIAAGFAKHFLTENDGNYVNALHGVYNSQHPDVAGNVLDVHKAMNDLAFQGGVDTSKSMPVPGSVDYNQTFGQHTPPKPLLDEAVNHPGIVQSGQTDMSKLGHVAPVAPKPQAPDWVNKLKSDAGLDDNWQDPSAPPPVKSDDFYINQNHDLLHDHDFYKTMPEDIRKSVLNYTSVLYEDINDVLRTPEKKAITPPLQRDIDNLDEVISKSQIEKAATLHRGVSLNSWRKRFAHLQPGDLYKDPGYMSTSVEPEVAKGFGSITQQPNPDMGALLHIDVDPGEAGFAPGPFGLQMEKEVILPRGTMLRITRIDHAQRRIYAEIAGGPFARKPRQAKQVRDT